MTGRRERLGLGLLLAVADVTLALSFESPSAWVVAALPLLAAAVPALKVPPRMVPLLVWISRALVAGIVARGEDLGLPLGLTLVVLGSIFLLDPTAFPPGSTALPAALGVLLGAAHKPVAPWFTPMAWTAAGVMALWLLSSSRLEARRLVSFLFLAVPSAVLAHGLIVFLPWAQPHVEEAAVQYITPMASSGLSIGARLGDMEELALSRRVILRMWSDAPMNLRVGVFTRFDGRGWQASKTVRAPHLFRPATETIAAPAWAHDVPGTWQVLPFESRGGAFARFVVNERTVGVLPAPANVDAVLLTDGPVQRNAGHLVIAPPLAPETYTLRFHRRPAPDPVDDPALAADSLELPPRIDPRLVALAARVGAGATTPREKIARTLDHLRSSYRYSLHVGRFRTNDPVAEFLFEKKKAYCEYFASAAVLMLRLQGVPARYVNGLSVRDDTRRGDHYVVQAMDAHAWAEALVPGVGWVEVDGTPPGDYEELHAGRDGAVGALLERWRAFFADLQSRIRQGGWKEVRRLLTAAGRSLLRISPWVLLASVVFLWVRRFRRRRRARPFPPSRIVPAPPELRACLKHLETLWTDAGCPRPPHRAPLEHAQTLPPEHTSPDLQRISVEVVLCFYRGAYGGEAIPASELSRLRQALEALPPASERL